MYDVSVSNVKCSLEVHGGGTAVYSCVGRVLSKAVSGASTGYRSTEMLGQSLSDVLRESSERDVL